MAAEGGFFAVMGADGCNAQLRILAADALFSSQPIYAAMTGAQPAIFVFGVDFHFNSSCNCDILHKLDYSRIARIVALREQSEQSDWPSLRPECERTRLRYCNA